MIAADDAELDATDAVLTQLGKGGAPTSLDVAEWFLVGVRDRVRFEADQPQPWKPFVPLHAVVHVVTALLVLSVLLGAVSVLVAPGGWMVTFRISALCVAIVTVVVLVVAGDDDARTRQ